MGQPRTSGLPLPAPLCVYRWEFKCAEDRPRPLHRAGLTTLVYPTSLPGSLTSCGHEHDPLERARLRLPSAPRKPIPEDQHVASKVLAQPVSPELTPFPRTWAGSLAVSDLREPGTPASSRAWAGRFLSTARPRSDGVNRTLRCKACNCRSWFCHAITWRPSA